MVATPVGSSTSDPSRNVTLYVITRAPFVKPGAAPGKAEWWLTGLRIRRLSAGLRNLIRTNASDIEVRLEDGSPMTLGQDYRVRDPERPSDPFFPDWSRLIPHQILPLPGGRLHRGDQVKVSYDFLPALPGEAMNALAEPRYYQALEHGERYEKALYVGLITGKASYPEASVHNYYHACAIDHYSLEDRDRGQWIAAPVPH